MEKSLNAKIIPSYETVLQKNPKLRFLKEHEDNLNKLPLFFTDQWEKIKIMRAKYPAEIDTMGPSLLAESHASRPLFKFQTLIALCLSSQTKDPTTAAAMERLILYGCTPQNLKDAPDLDIKDCIFSCSFHNNKVKYIKQISKVIDEEYNGDPPEERELILNLPGIGPKMTFIYLQACCDKIEGIAVDTHVHRICNRLGWINTNNPEQSRKSLETKIEREKWRDLNELIVGFGQAVCKAKKPLCSECLISDTCLYFKNLF